MYFMGEKRQTELLQKMAMDAENESMLLVESIEKADLRRQRERERAAWRRHNETSEQTLLRRQKEKERAARRRQNEDPIQTQLRLKRDRERAAERRRHEFPEQTLLRLKRERERTAQRRRRKILPFSSENSDVSYTDNNTTQQFQLQFTKEDNEKMMAPFIQSESYQKKWSPIIGDNSAASASTTLCSSPVRDDISQNLSATEDNSLSVRPQFLSVLSKYHCMLLSNLATFWKNGQYCDATIETANSKILVHKLLLLAISPKLQYNVQVPVSSFLKVKFSQEVNKAGLNAFADYMYNGILSLDSSLLFQLQTIAQQLDIKELELLCKDQLVSSNTKPNIQQTDSLVSASSSDVSISFTEGNFNIKKESFIDESSDYFADSASELVSINQTFPSENGINHLHHDKNEDDLISNHVQNFQATENHFEKKHPTLSQTSAQCNSAFVNETEIKDYDSFALNSSKIELKAKNLNSQAPKAQNLGPIEQGPTVDSFLTF